MPTLWTAVNIVGWLVVVTWTLGMGNSVTNTCEKLSREGLWTKQHSQLVQQPGHPVTFFGYSRGTLWGWKSWWLASSITKLSVGGCQWQSATHWVRGVGPLGSLNAFFVGILDSSWVVTIYWEGQFRVSEGVLDSQWAGASYQEVDVIYCCSSSPLNQESQILEFK